MSSGLFERWLALERNTGRPLGTILADINAACGRKYQTNWPTVMAARHYSLDRCPTNVRQYMLKVVLADELRKRGLELSEADLSTLVQNLT